MIQPAPTLRRALGRWDLTAIGVNQVIGASIFLMPAQIAAEIGGWSPIAVVLMGLASLTIALCFAEVGSRFDGTGGPYLYTRSAFGRFIGFEVGWMQWFVRAASQATVMAGTALALGYYWPAVTTGWPHALFLAALTTVLAWVNVLGVRQASWVVNALTVGKLIPLLLFIGVGAFYVQRSNLAITSSLPPAHAGTAALLIIYMYGGYEVVPVPGGEVINPRRDVPFAMIATLLAVTTVTALTQTTAQGVLPDLAAHTTPVADAAAIIVGSAGALLIGIGSVVSMTGNNLGQVLTGARMLFALAEQGDLPAVFGRVHPRFRTPHVAILFTSAIALALAVSGSFAQIAVVSSVARLVTYSGVSAATLRLRSPQFAGSVKPPTFVTPLGPAIPMLALLIVVAVGFGATRQQLLGGAVALAAGAVMFVIRASARAPQDASRV
jgi:amino acid transporter